MKVTISYEDERGSIEVDAEALCGVLMHGHTATAGLMYAAQLNPEHYMENAAAIFEEELDVATQVLGFLD